jgi:methylmalonyl-CoA mutase N-terminal domain/subunit
MAEKTPAVAPAESTAKRRTARAAAPPRKFVTVSSEPIAPLYKPEDIPAGHFEAQVGEPGAFPYTRGVHRDMYRKRLWTMRQFSGMATPEATNQRYHYLLGHGQTGLSVAFDLPTLMGYDSDRPQADGEVGVCGVAVDSLRDMEVLFDGIDLGEVSTSMTINSPASMLLAMYVAVAEKQGVSPAKLRGTLQNDILKEYIAQKEFIYPPAPSMRLIVDLIEYCTAEMPLWNTISISGYHIREAGSTAIQELAFTLADGFAYVEAARERGLDVDDFAPRLSFFFNAHMDFFEEVAKYRAARRIWARHMKERYGAQTERSLLLRFHTQTAGCSLTAQQPELNIVRTACEALSAVMGGTQSLHTNSMDETLALPSDKAARIALRTQQVLAYETGVVNTVDPLAGSYFVEALTDRMEEGAETYFAEIEKRGGVLRCIESGYLQHEIARAASVYQEEIDRKDRIIVGVNDYVLENEEIEIPVLKIEPQVQKDQIRNLQEVKGRRDDGEVRKALAALRQAARGDENTMPRFIHCARVYCTLQEMCDVLREEWGEYVEKPVF